MQSSSCFLRKECLSISIFGCEEYFEYAKTGGPDESCLFDISQIKCLPFPSMNDTQRAQCSEGFWPNEDDRCVPEHDEGCPEVFHSTDEDESGQCYTYTKGCEYEGFVLTKSEYTGADICREYAIDCDLNEDHPLCNGEERTDGIKVCDEPDHPGYKFCN